MNYKKNSSLVKILCLILCFSFIFMAASSMVFAKGNQNKDKDKDKNYCEAMSDKHGNNITSGKTYSTQDFILDSMESKKNKEIAKKLSECTQGNISTTAKSITSILKGKWDSKKVEAAIKKILTDYLGFTPKAKLALSAIIGEGFTGVEIPANLSNKIRLKINYDITGDPKDDQGIKFMVKAMQILQRIASLNNEKLVTLTLDNYVHSNIKFNRLENYSYITSSISEVLGTLQSLPFKTKNFQSFIGYYEKYLNSCSTFEAISFLYLLKANHIPYAIDIE